MDIEMFGKISDAFGPSGFEEEVVRTVAGYCGKYQVENDAMNNLYVRMPGRAGDKTGGAAGRPSGRVRFYGAVHP